MPARANRGNRMKSLQEIDLKGDNELYDLIFAEKSSDEDFNPSGTDMSLDDSIEKQDESEKSEEENKYSQSIQSISTPPKKMKKLGKPKIQKGAGTQIRKSPKFSNKKQEEEIIDLDMIDLDKIDEIEDRRDRGEDLDEQEAQSEGSSEFSSFENKKNKKKISKKIRKSIPTVENDDEEPKFIGKKTVRKKAFIEVSDDDDYIKKPRRPQVKERGRKIKPKKISQHKMRKNKNVVFKNNYNIMIVNKSIFFEQDDSENYPNENLQQNDYDEEDMMKYNDEENKNTKNIIKKFKKQEKSESAPVKYTFMQEKLSQKELLLEAIFTEYYNIQSLQEMQRLEDLNKKEMSTPGKKQFSEFVRIIKGVGSFEKCINENENNKEINETSEEIKKNENELNEKQLEEESSKKIRKGNSVTFSNPIIFEKIFESFNRPPQVKLETTTNLKVVSQGMISNQNISNIPINSTTQLPGIKEKKLCIITGQPAKYFDPLTKQPYADKEAFKILRERYFQKEEDSLLFRIQTLSDLASQKKEKLKKIILSEGNVSKDNAAATKNILNMVNRYGILKSDGGDLEKKVISRKNKKVYLILFCNLDRIYNRNRENCVESGMLVEAKKKLLRISKKIFRDKYSNRNILGGIEDEK